jgi:6-phosphogluconolactonase
MSNAPRSRMARRGYWAAGTALAAVALTGVLAPSAFAAGSPPPALYSDFNEGVRFSWTGGSSNTSWVDPQIAGRQGFDAAVSPDGRTAYFVDEVLDVHDASPGADHGAFVVPFTVATGQPGSPIATLPPSPLGTLRHIALSPGGSIAYVSGSTGIYPVTLSTGAVGAELATGPVTALAVSTNGKFVYATVGNDLLKLNAKSGAELGRIGLGQGGGAIKLSADGRTAYVIADTTGVSGAKLVKVDLSTFAVKAEVDIPGSKPGQGSSSSLGLALSPDQSLLYVTGIDGSRGQFQDFYFAAPVVASTLHVGHEVDFYDVVSGSAVANDAAFSPDGKTLYTFQHGEQGSHNDLVSIDVASNSVRDKSDGASSNRAVALDSVVVPADQAPVAAFTEKVSCAGTATFNARASKVAVGTVVRYAWNFGDGTTRVTAVPQVKHSYDHAGTYHASVTETDSDGTSTHVVFDGQTVLLNGGPSAQARHTIIVKACAAVAAKDLAADQAAPSSAADLTSLPRTGTQTWDELIVAGLLLAGGAGMVTVTRRRRG